MRANVQGPRFPGFQTLDSPRPCNVSRARLAAWLWSLVGLADSFKARQTFTRVCCVATTFPFKLLTRQRPPLFWCMNSLRALSKFLRASFFSLSRASLNFLMSRLYLVRKRSLQTL